MWKVTRVFFNHSCLSLRLGPKPFSFAVVLYEITQLIQEDVSWYMLFADDIILVDEIKEWVNVKLKRYICVLVNANFNINELTKTL